MYLVLDVPVDGSANVAAIKFIRVAAVDDLERGDCVIELSQ